LRLPDFIIGGAPRSGTTWLYYLLDRHPQVYMNKPVKPEPKFFLVDDLYQQGLEYYAATWFAGAAAGQVVGEKTTNYLENAVAASRIHLHLPQVKLIFILRDPVDRAFNNYLWSKMNGMENEDFATALALEEKRERELPEALKYARPHDYFARGLYAKLLAPYFALFPRNQLLCLKFEDIISNPQELAAQLYGFLRVAARPQDVAGLRVINAAEGEDLPMPAEIKAQLRSRYAEPNRELSRLLGKEFSLWDDHVDA
jgi:hypothetical protein